MSVTVASARKKDAKTFFDPELNTFKLGLSFVSSLPCGDLLSGYVG
jgi:hypothetical protein